VAGVSGLGRSGLTGFPGLVPNETGVIPSCPDKEFIEHIEELERPFITYFPLTLGLCAMINKYFTASVSSGTLKKTRRVLLASLPQSSIGQKRIAGLNKTGKIAGRQVLGNSFFLAGWDLKIAG
jgi:hypothetical protein